MDAEVKRKWVERLRDPESKQAFGQLGDGNGAFCCLGHLCEIAFAEGIVRRGGNHNMGYTYGEGGSLSVLPREVIAWADTVVPDPVIIRGGYGRASLAELNDNARLTLPEIAQCIEDYL